MPRTKPQRQCGSCAYWHKGPDGRGLCDKLDCAGKAEHGRGCPHWKGKKYRRHNDVLTVSGGPPWSHLSWSSPGPPEYGGATGSDLPCTGGETPRQWRGTACAGCSSMMMVRTPCYATGRVRKPKRDMMSDYTFKYADGTGKLQRGHYAHNETPDCMAEEDRWIGPWRTEGGARSAVRKAEAAYTDNYFDMDAEVCRLAVEASKTPAMKRAREAHDRVRAYMG